MSKRILFFGNERLATGLSTKVPVLKALLAADYEVAAIVVAQNAVALSRQERDLEISNIAKAHNIELLKPKDLNGANEHLASYQAEAGVLVAYGKILPTETIKLLPKGIINLHPSLLPKHRGPTPIESVILSGEDTTGVSLMALGADLDSGPIYAQQTLPLNGDETKQQLADSLGSLGGELLAHNLETILDGILLATPQDDSRATYDKKIVADDGLLDFNKPAIQLERQIRAYAGWPRSRTRIKDTQVTVTRAHVGPGNGQAGSLWQAGKEFGFYTSEDILIVDELIPAGKKNMPAIAFLAGYSL